MGFFEFWRKVFSDRGEPSLSRVGTGIALLFSCGWVTDIVYHSKALPEFAGIAHFIGTLYALNMGGKVGQQAVMKKEDQTAPPQP